MFAHAGLKFKILLPQPPEGWDGSHVPPYPPGLITCHLVWACPVRDSRSCSVLGLYSEMPSIAVTDLFPHITMGLCMGSSHQPNLFHHHL